MAINWKLRENVFRLLAAVYAELGETAFKGRYSSIAKFYGTDATYDAVKSFFAKEIAKAADELQDQSPDHQRTVRTAPQKPSSSKSSRRTLHLDFNDHDISFVSEREVEAHSRHALQRPPKRARLVESSQPAPGEDGLTQLATAARELSESHRTHLNGFQSVNQPQPSPQPQINGFRRVNERQSYSQHDSHNPPDQRELTSNLTDPSYVPSPSPEFQPPSRSQAALRKRPYKAVPEFDHEYQTVLSSSHTGTEVTQDPESFGYVTNAGFFRCALCFSQLSSQEALDKHEAMSKLHLRNLKNPAIVSKGRAKLAQVTALPYQSSASPTAFRPLRLGGFGEREEPPTNDTASLAGASCSETAPSSSNQQPEPQNPGNQAKSSRAVDTIEVLRHAASSPPSQVDASGDSCVTLHTSESDLRNGRLTDKGKRRASQAYQAPIPNPVSQIVPPRDEPIKACPLKATTNADANNNTTSKPPSSKSSSLLRPLEVAEILRLTGIRLAEKYIAEHPDLIAQTMGRVQREFTAASASVNGSVAPASVELRGESEVAAERKRQQAGNELRANGAGRTAGMNKATMGTMQADVVILD